MRVGLLLVACAAFGAADQYVGSVPTLSWGTSVSLLSEPWLLIGFIAGWTRRDPRSAMLLGLACTYAALLGYGVMTLSPIEDARLTVHSVLGFCRSEAPVLVGAVVTGPVFGWFGYRWRVGRAWAGALAVTFAFCLEPLAERAVRPGALASSNVASLELVAGLLMTGYVVVATQHRRRTGCE